LQIGFHGAAQTVTGSRHLLTVNGHRLLLECGLYQGRRRATYQVNASFPFEPAEVDAVVISHAHIDHIGNLPNLVGQGFDGPIHATHATRRLTDLLLRDSAHIQEEDAEYLNRKRERQGKELIEPLYTSHQAEIAVRSLTGHDYGQPFEPVPGVQVTYVEAGHILGSAGVVLDIDEGGRTTRLMFSGDIGRRLTPILRDPVQPHQVDFLIMECTYGDKPHQSPDQAFDDLRATVARTIDRGGKVIIPAFAVGRTQALVYSLHQLFDRGELPAIPVFVDSPLAINVTTVFREHPECYDEQAQAFLRQDPHGSVFGFADLKYTLTVKESKEINNLAGPAVIISASGMAEVGRILHHLKNNIEDPANTILINSWMAPHTLGRRLVDGEQRVKIFGEAYNVKAEVVRIDGFSAHAGQHELVDYALASRQQLQRIFLVHGEAGPAAALTERLAAEGMDAVHYPAWDEVVTIGG